MTNNNLQKTLCNGMLYGLKVEMYNKVWDLSAVSVNSIGISRGKIFDSIKWDFGILPKPYLFDLTKEIERGSSRIQKLFRLMNCENESHYNFLKNELINISKNGVKIDTDYGIVEWMIEHHFNVFGLEEDQFIRVTEELNPYK